MVWAAAVLVFSVLDVGLQIWSVEGFPFVRELLGCFVGLSKFAIVMLHSS